MNPIRISGLGLWLGSALLLLVQTMHVAQSPAQMPVKLGTESVAQPECNGWGGKPVARTELFFGMARPDGSAVSGDEFQRFVDQEVTPRFPSGLTLLGGNGQFRDASGVTIRENSKLLILLYPYNRDNSRNIEAIRAAYAKNFQQESVLRVDGSSCVSF